MVSFITPIYEISYNIKKGVFILIYFTLIFALSIDTFLASISYVTSRIHIPLKTSIVISSICSMMLLFSLLFGSILYPVLPHGLLKWISFFLLLGIAITKTFESTLQSFLKKRNRNDSTLQFSLFNFHFILSIYSDYKKADSDHSKQLSMKEAIPLSIALSMDALTAGLAFGNMHHEFLFVFFLCFFVNFILIQFAKLLGTYLEKIGSIDFSFISGILFFLLAFLRL